LSPEQASSTKILQQSPYEQGAVNQVTLVQLNICLV